MLISSQQREFVKWVVGVGLTVSAILLVTEAPLKDLVLNGGRLPASLSTAPKAKMDVLLKHEAELKTPQGKGSGIVEIAIQSSDRAENGTMTLEATVEAQSDQGNLRFAWLLPSEGGVSVDSGTTEGVIGDLKEGQKATVTLKIHADTAQNRRVHLHVFKMLNGEAMGRMAQYNTVDQEKIDAHVREKADVLSQSAEANSGESQKIMQ